MNDHNEVIDAALLKFPVRGRESTFADQGVKDEPVHKEDLVFALQTPDMYPGAVVAAALGVGVMKIHAWRRERGIRKADS